MKNVILVFFLLGSTNICLAQTWYNFASGINGDVEAIVEDSDGGVAFAAGEFSMAGGVAVSNIAMWNGTAWSAVGAGLNGKVTGLAIYKGDLYAAGSFSSPGLHFAKWDGNSWAEVGGGTNSTSITLHVFNDLLYVGGAFTQVGNVAASKIAAWDGSAWSALGSGLDNNVFAIGDHDGALYVGGEFVNAGAVAANRIAKWDGTNWTALGVGPDAPVWSIASFGGELIIGGQFNSAGSAASAVRIAKWNGTMWSQLGSSLSGNVFALGVYDGRLWAGGDFNSIWATQADANRIAVWDGTAWAQAVTGLDGPVYSMYGSSSAIYIGGQFSLPGFSEVGITAVGSPLSVGIEEDLFTSRGNSLEANFPNPFSYRTEIPFQLGRLSDIQFEIRDILGRVVKTIEVMGHQAGRGQLVLQSVGLSSGHYSITMKLGETSKTRMIQIER